MILAISRAMTATSTSAASALMPSRLTTTLWVGGSGVRPDRTRKVASADSSAAPTAIMPTSRNEIRRPGIAPKVFRPVDFSIGNDCSALAIDPQTAES
jgi:hypothetical protein